MTDRFHGWLRTAEAALALTVARALVRFVPMRMWGGWFADSEQGAGGRPGEAIVRHRAAAIERAAKRLPGRSPCLARSIAMALMLRRRGLGSSLVIGIRHPHAREGQEDLHAWLQHSGRAIYGERDAGDAPLNRPGRG